MTLDRRVVRYQPWHHDWVMKDAPNGGILMDLPLELRKQIAGQNSWTGVVDGDPVACAGTVEHWPGRHLAWAYMTPGTKAHMRWITEAVKDNLATVKGRIEVAVKADYLPGHKWARILGFEVEAPLMRQWGPDGADYTGYVRIN